MRETYSILVADAKKHLYNGLCYSMFAVMGLLRAGTDIMYRSIAFLRGCFAFMYSSLCLYALLWRRIFQMYVLVLLSKN